VRVNTIDRLERWHPEVVTLSAMIDHVQRRVWDRERSRLGLAEDDVDVTRHPVLARLGEPTVGVMLLPADPLPPDPLAAVLDFDDGSLVLIPERLTGRISNGVSFLNTVEMTGQYLLRVARNQHDEPARAVVGFARHGGVVAGVGTMGSYQPIGEKYGIYRLSAFAGAIRAALRTQEALLANPRVSSRLPAGPFELVVVAPAANGTLLGGYAEGWEPVDQTFDPPLCTTSHPVVRLEIDAFPTDNTGLTELLTRAMSRVVNLFGTSQPLYLDRTGTNTAVTDTY